MADHATPNLPSRDFEATLRFYGALGFVESWRDEGWMILKRGGLTLEFFPYPDLDPLESSFGCCLRLDELERFYAACKVQGFILYPGKLTQVETFRVGCIGAIGRNEMAQAVQAVAQALHEMGIANGSPAL